MRILLISNCQRAGLAACLREMLPHAELVDHPLHALGDAAVVAAVREGWAGFDRAILHPQAAERFAALTGVPDGHILTLPPFAFAGLHPDLLLLPEERGLKGPTGPMHSRIALAGHVGGLSVAETAALYNGLVFGRLGYYAAFQPHWTMLVEAYARQGLDLAPALARRLAAGPICHTPIHPTIAVLWDIARLACARLGLAAAADEDPPADLTDVLAQMPAHPTHGPLAARQGGRGGGVWRAGGKWHRPATLTLEEFLEASFRLYAQHPTGQIVRRAGIGPVLEGLGI